MNAQEINHAMGLLPALRAKARDLRDEAAALDAAKEGRSVAAVRLRAEAERCERIAHELKSSLDEEFWLQTR